LAGCCGSSQPFDGASRAYRHTLVAVIAINAAMFAVEMTAGAAAGSMALRADALDFLGDTLTYGLSLWVIGRPPTWRARAALLKGATLAVAAVAVLGVTGWKVLTPSPPEPVVMGAVGGLALAANVVSALLLFRFRSGDSNVRSVWLCSRNDAVGNLAVVAAASGVWATATGWPDLIVAALLAGLFLASARGIARQALDELRAERHAPGGVPSSARLTSSG